mmetsp:Transcript_30208/g.76311  ORF Transcript_30208/g.76311 Transcript_30208/m.76311 type:complete len:208 (-) Transcript_30208:1-624(-)
MQQRASSPSGQSMPSNHTPSSSEDLDATKSVQQEHADLNPGQAGAAFGAVIEQLCELFFELGGIFDHLTHQLLEIVAAGGGELPQGLLLRGLHLGMLQARPKVIVVHGCEGRLTPSLLVHRVLAHLLQHHRQLQTADAGLHGDLKLHGVRQQGALNQGHVEVISGTPPGEVRGERDGSHGSGKCRKWAGREQRNALLGRIFGRTSTA